MTTPSSVCRCVFFLVLLSGVVAAQEKQETKRSKTSERTTTKPASAGKTDTKTDTKTAAEKAAEHAKKIRKLQHELEIAELQLQISEIDTSIKNQTSSGAFDKARRDLQSAEEAYEQFKTRTVPREIDLAKISLDAAKYRAEHAVDEHKELEAMYKADEFAEMTKELVLKRSRRQLELAERSLQVQKKKLDDLQTAQHPRKLRELENKVLEATRAVELARQKLQKTKLEIQISRTKASFQVKELGRDLEAALKKAKS